MGYLKNLQAMRGVAALMVVLVHSTSIYQSGNLGAHELARILWTVGPAGVDVFFVISGFIISTVALEASRHSGKSDAQIAYEFAVKRAARIYPAYWVALLFAFALWPTVLVSAIGWGQAPLWKLALLVERQNYLIIAAWTLVYEMYFYLTVAAILLIAPRHLMRGLAIWGAASMAGAAVVAFAAPQLQIEIPFSPLIGEFLLGVALGHIYRTGEGRYPVYAIVVGAVWFIAAGNINLVYFNYANLWFRLVGFGVGATLILYGVLVLERDRGVIFPRAWQRLGDASYSIYIWHQPIYAAALALVVYLGLGRYVPMWAFIVPFVLIVLVVGFLSFHFIERPAQSFINRALLPFGSRARLLPVALAMAALFAIATIPTEKSFYKEPRETLVAAGAGKIGVGDASVSDATRIDLPPSSSFVRIAVSSSSAGKLYTGYHVGGTLKQKWTMFDAGETTAEIDLQSQVDGSHIWLQIEKPRPAEFKIVSIEAMK